MPENIESQQAVFNQRVTAFIERYAPRSYEGRDFEIEIRTLMMEAMRIAQLPFVYELQLHRDAAIKNFMVQPTVVMPEKN